MRALLAQFRETGLADGKIERFLNSEPSPGGGSIRDQIAADMTNQLLHALGQDGQQTSTGVKRLRERGSWKTFDRPPSE